jgi:hypothetical protein
VNGLPDFFLGFGDDQARCDVASVFFVILGGVDKCGCLLVAEVHFVAQNMDVEEFPDIFFALIGIESFFSGESLSDFGQLLLNPFGL